jgi:hypothetical protein
MVVFMRAHYLGVLLVACSGSVALSDMPAQTAKTICAKYYACCTSAELMGTTWGPDQPTCESKLTMQFDATKNTANTDQGKGRVAYHGDQLGACLAAYPNLTCEQLKTNATSTPMACNSVFEPKVAAGAACGADNECIGGSCIGVAMGADGMCVAFATENTSCTNAACGTGLYCKPGDNTCQKTKDDGATCNLNLECTTGGCNGRNPDAGTPGTCGLKGGTGTTCYATTGCSVAGGAPALLALVVFLRRRRREA